MKKADISLGLAVGFEKLFYGQMKNYLDELKMIWWNSLDITCRNEGAISPAGLASQVTGHRSQVTGVKEIP